MIDALTKSFFSAYKDFCFNNRIWDKHKSKFKENSKTNDDKGKVKGVFVFHKTKKSSKLLYK